MNISQLPNDVLLRIFRNGCLVDVEEIQRLQTHHAYTIHPFAQAVRLTCWRWNELMSSVQNYCGERYQTFTLAIPDIGSRQYEPEPEKAFQNFVNHVSLFKRTIVPIEANTDLHLVLNFTNSPDTRPGNRAMYYNFGPREMELLSQCVTATVQLIPISVNLRSLCVTASSDTLTNLFYPLLRVAHTPRLEHLCINRVDIRVSGSVLKLPTSIYRTVLPSVSPYSILDCSSMKALTELNLWNTPVLPSAYPSHLESVTIQHVDASVRWEEITKILDTCSWLQRLSIDVKQISNIPYTDPTPDPATLKIRSLFSLQVDCAEVDKVVSALFAEYDISNIEALTFRRFTSFESSTRYIRYFKPLVWLTSLSMMFYSNNALHFLAECIPQMPMLRSLRLESAKPDEHLLDSEQLSLEWITSPPTLTLVFHSIRFLKAISSIMTFDKVEYLSLFIVHDVWERVSFENYTDDFQIYAPSLEKLSIHNGGNQPVFPAMIFDFPSISELELFNFAPTGYIFLESYASEPLFLEGVKTLITDLSFADGGDVKAAFARFAVTFPALEHLYVRGARGEYRLVTSLLMLRPNEESIVLLPSLKKITNHFLDNWRKNADLFQKHVRTKREERGLEPVEFMLILSSNC